MKTYPLATWLQIKEHQKKASLQHVHQASKIHEEEKLKLIDLEASLKTSTFKRFKQKELFLASENSHSSLTGIQNFASLHKKQLKDESEIKALVLRQKAHISNAKNELWLAQNKLHHAHIDLKLAEKHFLEFQQSQKKAFEKAIEELNDDQNGVRFYMRKA
jgi:hypothetical protein